MSQMQMRAACYLDLSKIAERQNVRLIQTEQSGEWGDLPQCEDVRAFG